MADTPLRPSADEYEALRTRVVLVSGDTLRPYRIRGPSAFDELDRAVTSDLYLQHAQLRQTLLLDDDGLVLADALVGREGDDYLLVVEALDSERADDLVRSRFSHASVEALASGHVSVGLHGPYAWELLGEWLGADLVGMPYLSSFEIDQALVLRAGNTGEYGYEVLLPKARSATLLAALRDAGSRFDMVETGDEALQLAALENAFFNIRREGRHVRDPLELQLRWRLSNDKAYVGREAVDRRAREGTTRRITWLTCDEALGHEDRVHAFGQDIGHLVHAGFSPTRGCWIGLAVLLREWAHAGIDTFSRSRDGQAAAIRTIAPPLLDNRSLDVSPQRHSYHAREGFESSESP